MIKVLYDGILVRDGNKVTKASSSVTFIKTKKHNIIVDTATRDKRNLIIKELNKLGLTPEDIDIVINTHDHWDHVENNDLFKNAKIITYYNYKELDDDEIKIIETPGHTEDSISVIYEDYIVVGDASPLKDNILKDIEPKLNIDEELALNTLKKIKSLKKKIITGHEGLI
ncbi:MBL fold metallo-hydrolase [Methanothermococcus okinawensis]|nr:MBL fold metallo-hydrolase [Methanothermococcus okinawensis]